ncbi:MAG: M48 family metallopeptidase [Acidobacteria bacterium]|nr:M48 family metallopeptidase [Acidobacteriota bacterium]
MSPALTTAAIGELYRKAFTHYDRDRIIPEINVSFYPYVGINHTIRVRDGRVYVRIAEICGEMPETEHLALAFILVSKLYRRRPPKWARETYAEYIKSDEIRELSTENKRTRGRKVITGTRGEFFDLNEVFDTLNATYFGGNLQKPTLTWSARRTYRILGHHDSTHDTIVISRSLDSHDTPRYVVEYVVFHEMLHIHHPTVHHNGRRYNHTPAFRRDERRFSRYMDAEEWIERNVRKMRRRARAS